MAGKVEVIDASLWKEAESDGPRNGNRIHFRKGLQMGLLFLLILCLEFNLLTYEI